MKRIFPHIFVFLTFCLCMYLGTWQLQRMQWKNDILAKIDSNLQTSISPDEYQDLENDEFKMMQISGKYLHDEEIHLLSRTYNGKAGTHVVTPLVSDSGDIFLINRGWVKADGDYEKPENNVQIDGVIRKSQEPSWLTLPNDGDKKHWFWLDLTTIYKHLNSAPKEFYLDRVSEEKSYPLALPKKIQLHNEHLQYVITWFSLSLALLVMYYFRFWKK